MSTPAHEPRRVGPRGVAPHRISPNGADANSANKVAPRRNTSDTIESTGIQYDGDEVPVLIRLPNLQELAPVASQPAPSAQRRHTRIDPPNHSTEAKSTTPSRTKKRSKRPIEPETNNTKLVVGGLLGGVLIAVALMLLSSGGNSEPEEQDGWATPGEAELLAEEPEISIPTESEVATGNEPPPLYPGFATEPPTPETAQLAGGEFDQTQVGVSYYDAPLATQPPETLALPTQGESVNGWPSEETLGASTNLQVAPPSGLTTDDVTPDPYNSPYPAADSPRQEDYRSSMYPSQTESYRMGRLDTDRSLNDRDNSILNGNIEVPPTTSLR